MKIKCNNPENRDMMSRALVAEGYKVHYTYPEVSYGGGGSDVNGYFTIEKVEAKDEQD